MGLKGTYLRADWGCTTGTIRYFFASDQVIDGIVPIVGTTYPDEHLLKGYFDSLEKLKHQYGDCLILPAHKEPIRDVKRVVDRIVFAYLDKTDLIKHILDHGHHRMTTKEVACLAYGIDHVPRDQSEFIKLKMVISKTFPVWNICMMRILPSALWRAGAITGKRRKEKRRKENKKCLHIFRYSV